MRLSGNDRWRRLREDRSGYRDGGKVQASVARCLRTPPYAAKRKGLVSATRTAYAARAIAGARLSLATVMFGPITVVPHRAKAFTFRRSSILFRPRPPPMRVSGGAAGYRPRVRSAYYVRVYRHSPGCPRHRQHRRSGALRQAPTVDDPPDQNPALIFSNSCNIRFRMEMSIGSCCSTGTSTGPSPASATSALPIASIALPLEWP